MARGSRPNGRDAPGRDVGHQRRGLIRLVAGESATGSRHWTRTRCSMNSSTGKCAGCAPNGTGSRPCPPSPTGGKGSPPGPVRRHLPGPPASERGAWLTSHGFVVHETGQRDLGRRERDSSPRVTVVRSGRKVHPFQVALNVSPQDGQAWPLVSSQGTHAPSNLLPQPGQSSGECSVILIPGRSSPPSLWRGRIWCPAVAFLSVSGNRLSGDAGKLPGGNVDLVKPD